jgi:hypothetical protein
VSTPLRRRTMSVLFDKPRKGWVAVLVRDDTLTDRQLVPVAIVPVPQREFKNADDVVINPRDGLKPTAFARKHLGDPVVNYCHYGRYGIYRAKVGHAMVIAQDYETALKAIIEDNTRGK